MGKIHIFKKKSNDFLSGRNDVITIPFENKTDMIKLLSEHLSYQYKKSFKDLKEKNPKEFKCKNKRVPKLTEALRVLLKRRLRFFKRVTITNKSGILKRAFEMAKIKESPIETMSARITYKIKGLEFQIIKER